MALADDTGVLVLPCSAELNTARIVADFAAEGLPAPVVVVVPMTWLTAWWSPVGRLSGGRAT